MTTFFFWFGVICFVLIVLFLIFTGVIYDIIIDAYRFLYKAYLIRNDKPKFEINDLVEWQGEEYKVYDIHYHDMNYDYKFRWVYMIQITDPNYKRDWDNDRSCATVWSNDLTKVAYKIREQKIDTLLQDE